jgi:hypothetical protein
MMSKHGSDKKRHSQREQSIRESNEGRPRDSDGSGQRAGSAPNHPASPAAPTSRIIPPEQIAVRAYEIWVARGKPAGTDREDWFEANRQLQEEIKHPSLENVPKKGTNPAEIGEHRLSDAIPHQTSEAAGDKGRRPVPTHEPAAEQIREADESEEARNARTSSRERMVDIGRGNQQAGRQSQ